MKKRIVVIMALALVAILAVGGTMAWFTANAEPETNTFKAGTVQIDLVDEFEGEDANNVTPGDCIDKEVYVQNTGTIDAYIRVKLTPKFENQNLSTDVVLYKVLDEGELKDIEAVDAWTKGGVDSEDGGTWYYYNQVVTAKVGETSHLIDKVCFAGKGMNNDYQGAGFTLTVTAEAVQADVEAVKDEWEVDPDNDWVSVSK